MNFPVKLPALGLALAAASLASAEVMDRPTGIKIGQRMTLRPYVSVSATYDSNVSGSHEGGSGKTDDIMWTVSPGLSLDYDGETWSLLLTAFYNYHAYCQQRQYSDYNEHSYGETLRWNWSDTKGAERGWSLMLSETFQQYTQADDMTDGDGRGYTPDRRQLSVQGTAQRRFNENWHSEISLGYYNLEYFNETENRNQSAFYGWQRWSGNWSAGFAPSPWTDFLVNLGYQGYRQDNTGYTGIARDSQGYTAQLGLGSYATERISYRLLAGWSRFEYGNDTDAADGFVYTVSGNWKISETWDTMLLATSYYQPSEREQASRSRVDSVSWGLGKSLVRGKLRAKLDVVYRRETNERVVGTGSYDYVLNTLSGRAGLDYTLNRFLALFLSLEYQRMWNDHSDETYGYNDYDRWRLTGGLRVTY